MVWLVFGVANLIRAGMTLYIAPALEGRTLSVSLPFLGSVYGLWGVIFLVAAVIAWRRKSTGGALGLALFYQAVLWILHLVGDRSTYARSLWARDVLMTLVFLAFIIILTVKINFKLIGKDKR
jgi:hypothetical protein